MLLCYTPLYRLYAPSMPYGGITCIAFDVCPLNDLLLHPFVTLGQNAFSSLAGASALHGVSGAAVYLLFI